MMQTRWYCIQDEMFKEWTVYERWFLFFWTKRATHVKTSDLVAVVRKLGAK